MHSRFRFVVSLTILLASGGLQAQNTPTKLSKECQDFLAALPKNYNHGWIQVPLNYFEPDARKIHIFFAVRSSAQSTDSYVTFLNGGPGTASHNEVVRGDVAAAVPSKNVVFMDQRGTGCSDAYPSEEKALINEYPFYFADHIARDLERVRANLKIRQWVVFGHSFGGLVASHYAALFPARVVRAVSAASTLMENPYRFGLMRLLAHDRLMNAYFDQFPEDEKQLHRIFKSLENLCLNVGSNHVCGRNLLANLGLFAAFRNQWEDLHLALGRMLKSDDTVEINLIKRIVEASPYATDDTIARLNILWNRSEAYQGHENSLSDYYENIYQQVRAEFGVDVSQWLIGEESFQHFAYLSDQNRMSDTVEIARLPNLSPTYLASVLRGHNANGKNLQVYFIAGELDSYYPTEVFADVAAEAQKPHSPFVYINAGKYGHDVYLSPAVLDLIRAE